MYALNWHRITLPDKIVPTGLHKEYLIKRLFDCMVFYAVSNSISVISRRPVHQSMLSLSLRVTSTPHNILSKPMAAFPHNHCRNNGQRWEKNESCRNDYHQSSERILAEPGIESATSCSQVRKATDWAMGLGISLKEVAYEEVALYSLGTMPPFTTMFSNVIVTMESIQIFLICSPFSKRQNITLSE